jgi:hypothetical protein
MGDIHTIREHYTNYSAYSESTLMQWKKRKLVKLLDKLCSDYVILRDRCCIVCGSPNNLSNGHYIRRGYELLRWNTVNCNCQCIKCNSIHEEDAEPYTRAMVRRYGESRVLSLVPMRIHVKLDRQDLVDEYFRLVENIKEVI